MSVKFYNPGTKIQETLRFDNPTTDPKHQNNISYYNLVAEAQSFFELPTEMEIESPNGPITIPVRFADTVQKDYQTYGCVRINPKAKDVADDANVALNEKEAKTKGDRLWREYLIDIARQYIINVQEIKAAGGVPRPAKGPIAFALKYLNMEDPADMVGSAVAHGESAARALALEKQVEELKQMVTQLAGKK